MCGLDQLGGRVRVQFEFGEAVSAAVSASGAIDLELGKRLNLHREVGHARLVVGHVDPSPGPENSDSHLENATRRTSGFLRLSIRTTIERGAFGDSACRVRVCASAVVCA